MKKLFSTILAAVVTLTAIATDYTGTLTVTINGVSAIQESTINLVDNGSNYTLSINNFVLDGIPVGNIVLTAAGTQQDEATILKANTNITITEGDGDGWIGPQLGEVPINMTAIFKDGAMYTNIDIYFAPLMQTINVRFTSNAGFTNHFGSDQGYQFPNSNFDEWHFYKTTGNSWTGQINHYEPTGWHGFGSAKGSLAGSAKGQVIQSDDTRTGSGSCALIQSGSTLGIVNNGTMTTGQLNAGSMIADDVANHSEMEVTSDNNDEKGYPYYVILNGRPDSFNTWHKYTQGSTNSSHPYATISAIITDGTYYQDPEDKAYNNKIAEARNTKISQTSSWKQLDIPFNYIDDSLTPKGILVTISTNADAGQGSNGDKVFIDDVALIYLGEVTNITVNGLDGFTFDANTHTYSIESPGTFTEDDITVTKTGAYSYLLKSVNAIEGGYIITITVIPNDMSKAEVYTINVTTPVTAVELEGVTFSETKKWATWIGDQDLAVPANVTASVVTGINGDVAQIESLDYIPAGVGVLLHSITAASNITTEPFTGTSTVTTNLLNGSANGITPVPTGAYLLYNDCFYLSQDGSTLDAHRCYLQLPSNMQNAPRMLKLSDSTVTAIETIGTSSNGPARYYDLNGREVNERATGILLRRNPDGTVTKIVK